MNNKELKFNLEAKTAIKKGIDILANAVKCTLGPQGQCVVIEDYDQHKPHVTKDGVTVAKNIKFKDKYMNAGACLIREASLKLLNSCGDATSTTTVLAQAFVNNAMKAVEDGANIADLKRGINLASDAVLKTIKSASRPIKEDDIESIATISANNDNEIGKMIADTFKKVTYDGVIVVEESSNINTSSEVIQGMQFDRGYLAPHFVTDDVKNQCILENPYILITEQKVNMMRELVPILEKVVAENRPILIIAEDYDSEVIENLKMNKLQGIVKVCPVKAPSFGEYRKDVLDDIAVLTGGTNLTYESGLYIPSIDVDMLGRCDKVIVTKDNTTIIGGKTSKEAVQLRVDQIKKRLLDVKASDPDNKFMTEFLSLRISKLVGGVATIHVGGTTELEMKERKDRVDDAVSATKAAVEEGVVAGGGITYLRNHDLGWTNNEDINTGMKIIISGLNAPFAAICENSGRDPIITLCKINPEDNIGYDANSDQIVNMLDSGILNPAKSERLAFENAVSVVNLFLSTNCVIVDEDQPMFIM